MEPELKVGMITKRAQQMKSFTPVNYKERVFVLTASKLSYYEGTIQQRGKIKGSFTVDSISYVGLLNDDALHRTSSFQILHSDYYLYCCAKSEKERNEWISEIKKACRNKNIYLKSHYHPKIFSGGRWQCCNSDKKHGEGCSNEAMDEDKSMRKPLPPLPKKYDDEPAPPVAPRPKSHSTSYPNGSGPLIPPSTASSRQPNSTIPRQHAASGSLLADINSHFNISVSPAGSRQNTNTLPVPASSLSRSSSSFPPPSSKSSPQLHHEAFAASTNTQAARHAQQRQYAPTYPEHRLQKSYPELHGADSNPGPQYKAKNYSYADRHVTVNDAPYTPQGRTVYAIHNFERQEEDDIPLVAGESYTVLDDSRSHWWKVQDKSSNQGYVPMNYLTENETEAMSGFMKGVTRVQTENYLKEDGKEGSFILRDSSQSPGMYTLSVLSKGGVINGPTIVKHYRIFTNEQGWYYLAEKHPMETITDLINYHKHNAGGLVTRLRQPPQACTGREQSMTSLFVDSRWEIELNEITMLQELGSGQFGVVKLANLHGTKVAVKIMKEGTMEEDAFIEEAEVMTKLQHPHLVQLYGVVTRQRPICIVTEFMEEGCLLDYIRKNQHLRNRPETLLDMSYQICDAMRYLEEQNLIHRDLAARNCLVGRNTNIKVADFGLTRYVLDDEYTSSIGSKFPIKWSSPEVLNYTKFSSKSDVWAFGILMWELFTGGRMPYRALNNVEVADWVSKGKRLERPDNCPHDVYSLMMVTWEAEPDNRPAFCQLFAELEELIEALHDSGAGEETYDA